MGAVNEVIPHLNLALTLTIFVEMRAEFVLTLDALVEMTSKI